MDESRKISYMNDRRAFLFVVLSVLILAHGSIIGPIGILAFYAMWLPQIQRRGVPVLKINRYNILPFAFLFWCLLSVLWSAYPKVSFKNGGEYISLVICTLIIAEIVHARVFLRALALGSFLTLLFSYLSGNIAVDHMSGTYSLVGLLGSKNQIGLFASILVVLSIVTLPITRGSLNKLITCFMPALFGFYCLHLSQSATSILALGTTLMVLVGLMIINWMPRGMRGFTFMFAALWFISLLAVGWLLNWHEYIFSMFGKSSTLTGRTLLWEKAWIYSQDHLVAGRGYGAFWVPGYMPAEHLWLKFDIASKRGFHFHNLFIQALADLGVVGATLLALMIFQTLWRAMRLALKLDMQVMHVTAAAFAFMYAVRAMAEVDLLGTFGIGPVVFYVMMQLVAPRPDDDSAVQKNRASKPPSDESVPSE